MHCHSIRDTLDCAIWDDDRPRPVLRAVPLADQAPPSPSIAEPVRVTISGAVLEIVDEVAPALCTPGEFLTRVMRAAGVSRDRACNAVAQHARQGRIRRVYIRGVVYWQRVAQP